MNNFLPTQCQKYLVESLDKRTTKNLSFELAEILVEYTKTTKKTDKSEFGGGAGIGMGPEELDTSKDFTNILFGSSPKVIDPLIGSATAYGIGKAASTAADILDTIGAKSFNKTGIEALKKAGVKIPTGPGFFGQLGTALTSTALGAIPGGISSLLKQVEDLSGTKWAESNIKRIGQSELELAAQGAGSPWTPFSVTAKKYKK